VSVEHLAGYGLIILFALLSATCFAWYRDIRRTRQGDAEVWQKLNDKKLPEYDGENYELPEWNDSYWPPRSGDTAAFPVIPASQVSGAFHVINPTDDTDAFIAAFTAETDAVVARLNEPLDIA
jgi:hypothetical protein